MSHYIRISDDALGTKNTVTYGSNAIRSIRETVGVDYLGEELAYDTMDLQLGQEEDIEYRDRYIEGNGAATETTVLYEDSDDLGFQIDFETATSARIGYLFSLSLLLVFYVNRSENLIFSEYNGSGVSETNLGYVTPGERLRLRFLPEGSVWHVTVEADRQQGEIDIEREHAATGAEAKLNIMGLQGLQSPNARGDRVYSFQLFKGSETICDLIPVQDRETEAWSWYDRVSGNSYVSGNETVLAGGGGETETDTGSAQLPPYTGQVLHATGESTAFDQHIYYVSEARRIGKALFNCACMCALGILDKQSFVGGLYEGTPLRSVLSGILGSLNRSRWSLQTVYADGAGNIPVYGWIPYCSKREALQQLCFAYGLQIRQGKTVYDGKQYPSFIVERLNRHLETTAIETDRIFSGGSEETGRLATVIELEEHSFYAYAETAPVVLFDNTADSPANLLFVQFQTAPIRVDTLETTGTLSVSFSGVNYAIVSGQGTLTGKPYEHSRTAITRTINDNDIAENRIRISDATLISTINSESVADRLADYYFNRYLIKEDIIHNGEVPGRLYSFQNPFGENCVGYLAKMEKVVSSFVRARCEFICGVEFGMEDSNFTSYAIVSASGSWTVPSGITRVRAVIIGGGAGGNSGRKGKNTSSSNGGAGGKGGSGGDGGKVLAVTIAVSEGDVFTIAIGAAGSGAAGTSSETDSTAGAEGGSTTLSFPSGEETTTYTSADGTVRARGVANPFTGDVYAAPGTTGTDGGKGGNGAKWDAESETIPRSDYGEDVGSGTGGTPGTHAGGIIVSATHVSGTIATGGAGGGASANTNGGNGVDGHYRETSTHSYYAGGKGGDGATPTRPAAATVYGSGGHGGHGGGGGGGNGAVASTESYDRDPQYTTQTAIGGNGGPGGNAAAGCVVIYY